MSDTTQLRHQAEVTAEDIRQLLREAEEALRSTTGEQMEALRERMRHALANGRTTAERLRDEAMRQAERADELVRSHPYQAIGVAMGVGACMGALLGFFVSRSNH